MSQSPAHSLLASNQQWAQSVNWERPDFFLQSTTGQSPKVLWIGCSDSRVPESVITGSQPGDIFVHRNIANQFHLHDDSALSALTYAVKVVGVEHVVLVGHTHCGGAAACLQAANDAAANPGAPLPHDTPLTRWLEPLTELACSLDLSACSSSSEAVNKLVEANVIKQVDNICRADPITTAWADPSAKKVTVHGWVYDLAEGLIKELVARSPPV